MGHALRYRDESELPESMQRLLARARANGERVGWAFSKEKPPKQVTRKPRRDLEHNEQVVLINRIKALAVNDPRFALAADRTHAIPNGGGRSRAEAGRLKAEGVKSGVSDLFLALPAGSRHGLYIEMKASEGRVSDDQNKWLQRSCELGYAAHVCWSADEAFQTWMAYVESSFQP